MGCAQEGLYSEGEHQAIVSCFLNACQLYPGGGPGQLFSEHESHLWERKISFAGIFQGCFDWLKLFVICGIV